MPGIVLTTLNARYIHASLGLRYLRSNLGQLRDDSIIDEFIIGQQTSEIVEKLLNHRPRVIGFGIYIWNVEETTKIVGLLKRVSPETVIILGGPEVSFEISEQPICELADYIITGWGDVTFSQLAHAVLYGPKPIMKIHAGIQPDLAQIVMPYREYTNEDIAHRTLYVEASRGCPFKCEFCLSALDKTAWPFPIDVFLDELDLLYRRGARLFKFVDRTFNLNPKVALKILHFFLDRYTEHDPVFAHFELIPDHLPDSLKEAIQQFPKGALQFEIGIQTLNEAVQKRISRKQNNQQAKANLLWLHAHCQAHLHVDLIAGLPGEDIQSFAAGFDELVGLGPHEIQLGILKRLRGAPIDRHSQAFSMVFSPSPPYEIVSHSNLTFTDRQRLQRFSRYWDLVANSGRFVATMPLLLQQEPFANFMRFSDWLYKTSQKTHQFAPEKLFEFLRLYLMQSMTMEQVDAMMALDAKRLKMKVSNAKLTRQERHQHSLVVQKESS